MPFKPGQSGNPDGMKPGTRHRSTKARKMLEARAEGIIAKVIEQAENGCTASQKLCVERLIPVYKPASAPVTLDGYEFLNSAEAKARAVADAVALGKIGPEAGRDFIMALQGQLTITKAGEERRALNELMVRAGLEPLDPQATEEPAA